MGKGKRLDSEEASKIKRCFWKGSKLEKLKAKSASRQSILKFIKDTEKYGGKLNMEYETAN